MKKVVEILNIKNLEKDWNKLVDPRNGKMYLTYKFHYIIYKCFRVRNKIQKFYKKMNLVYFCLINDSEILAIFPLIIDNNSNSIYFAGDYAESGYNDIIGGDTLNKEDISMFLEYLKYSYPGYKLWLREILESSILYDLLNINPYKECFSLECNEGFDSWFKSLSRHTRSSISTAYNRCYKNNLKIEFHCSDNLKLSTNWKLYWMYTKHLAEIMNCPSPSNIQRCISFFKSIFAVLLSPMFVGINYIDREKIAYLTINNKIAAFSIIYEEEGGIIFPKCSFDSKYKFYSPGSINYAEIIKYYTNNNEKFIFDFSRGYHEYKIKYGCKPYSNYCFEYSL